MEAACAALVATYLAGVQLDRIDKTIVYEIPVSALARLSVAERLTARACATRLGIRYRITKPQPNLRPTAGEAIWATALHQRSEH